MPLRTRVRSFARVRTCALPPLSVRAATQDRRGSITGQNFPRLEGHAARTAVQAHTRQASRLAAPQAGTHDAFDAGDPFERADRDRAGLGGRWLPEHDVGGRAELLHGNLAGRLHLEALLDAARRAAPCRRPRAAACPGKLLRRRARRRDVTCDRDRHGSREAARETIGAIGAAEVEDCRRPRVARCTRPRAPDLSRSAAGRIAGAYAVLFEPRREAAALTARESHREEREEPAERGRGLRAGCHARSVGRVDGFRTKRTTRGCSGSACRSRRRRLADPRWPPLDRGPSRSLRFGARVSTTYHVAAMAGNEGDGGDRKQPPVRRAATSGHDDEPTQIMPRPHGLEPPPRRAVPAHSVRPPQPRPAAGARPLPPPPAAAADRTVVMREAPGRGPGVVIPSERWPAPTPPPRSVQRAQVPAPRAPAPRPPIQRVAQPNAMPAGQRPPAQPQQRPPEAAAVAPRAGAAHPASQRLAPPGQRPAQTPAQPPPRSHAQPSAKAAEPRSMQQPGPPMITQPMPQRSLPQPGASRGAAMQQPPRGAFPHPQPHHERAQPPSVMPQPPRPASSNPPPYGQTTLMGGVGMSSPPPAQAGVPNIQSYMVPSYDPSRGADQSQPLPALLGSPYPPPAYASQPQHHSQQPPPYAPPPPQPSAYPRGGPRSGGEPHQQGSTPPPQQQPQYGQPALPAHFAQPQRAMPSSPAPKIGSVAPPAERSSRQATAMPLGPGDDLFLPAGSAAPPSVFATCVFLGGPLLVATMVVAMLAFR